MMAEGAAWRVLPIRRASGWSTLPDLVTSEGTSQASALRREERGPWTVFAHSYLPTVSFPKRKGNCWVLFLCLSFVFPLQDYVLWLGVWEFCFCGPKSHHFSNFSRWELVCRPLKETSQLPGGLQAGLPALPRAACSWIWRGAAFLDLALGPCPHFNDTLEPGTLADWEK